MYWHNHYRDMIMDKIYYSPRLELLVKSYYTQIKILQNLSTFLSQQMSEHAYIFIKTLKNTIAETLHDT